MEMEDEEVVDDYNKIMKELVFEPKKARGGPCPAYHKLEFLTHFKCANLIFETFELSKFDF